MLVFGLRGFAFVAIAQRAIEVALKLFIVDFELVQSAAFFRVVLAAKNLASFDRLPFAAAEFDQPAPLKRNDLCQRSGSTVPVP